MTTKKIMYAGVAALAAIALLRAATFRFQEKEQAIVKANQEQMQKMGLTRDAAKAKFPTPQIAMVSSGCLLPGGTGEVVVKGKFVPDTKFVIQNDNIEVIKESLVGGEYRATVKVAPGIGPQTADIVAISPVSSIGTRSDGGVTIGGRYEWTMEAANGWKVVARSPADRACGSGPTRVQDTYEMVFYRQGETGPFEKRSAIHHYSMWERTNHRFSISHVDQKSQSEMEDMTTLMKKMMDPKLSEAERAQLMKKMEAMQAQMRANMAKMADLANAQKMAKEREALRQQFGCERLDLEVKGEALTGQMVCSETVGRRIALTGTMKFLGR